MAEIAKAQLPLQVQTGPFRWFFGWFFGIFAFLFYSLSIVGLNFLQMLSLVLIPFSRPAFRAVNRFYANAWWGWCVIGAEEFLRRASHFYG